MSADPAVRDNTGRDDAGDPLVSLRGIEKSYGSISALRGVDLDLRAGEVHGLVGDNGAGKSTLVKVLAGAHSPDAGTIMIDGSDHVISNPKDATALGIATVFQNLALVDCRSVAENVFLGREPTRRLMVDRRRIQRSARERIASLGIANMGSVDAEVRSLSGGQRQAVAIARAVEEGKRILILDEPTAALGVRESRSVIELIQRLKRRKIAIVLVSHNLVDVFDVTDRITVLRGGLAAGTRVTSETTPDDIVGLITGAGLV